MSNTILLGNIRKLWWMPLLTGLIAVGLGIWTLLCPATSIPFLAYVFAGCLVAAGLIEFGYSGMMARENAHWGWSLVIGTLDIIAGVWMFTLPAEAIAVAFMYIVGIWLLVVAINSLLEASVISAYSPWWIFWMILMLVATIVLVVIFLSNPIVGGVAVWLYLGWSLIVYGVYRIILAARLKSLKDEY